LVLDYSVAGKVLLSDGGYSTFARLTIGSTAPAAGASANLDDPLNWCVSLTDPDGDVKTFKYSAMNGLEAGACS
jgi:hypothetical protein